MKVYRLLSHLGLCALLLSCAMPALGAAGLTREQSEKKTQLEQSLAEAKALLDDPFENQVVAKKAVEAAKKELEDFNANPAAAAAAVGADAARKEELEQDLLEARQYAADGTLKGDDRIEADAAVAAASAALDAFNKGGAAAAAPAAKQGYLAWLASPFRKVGSAVASGAASLYSYIPTFRSGGAAETAESIQQDALILNYLINEAKFKDAALTKAQSVVASNMSKNSSNPTKSNATAAEKSLTAFVERLRKSAEGKKTIQDFKASQFGPMTKADTDSLASLETAFNKAQKAYMDAKDDSSINEDKKTKLFMVYKNAQTAFMKKGGKIAVEPVEVEETEAPVFGPMTEEQAIAAGQWTRPATPQDELAAVKSALSGGARMSYRQHRAAKKQADAQQPQRSGRGALTKSGQMARLEQRQAAETAQRVQTSILANNSLPSESNRDEWVRLFVNTYESPYVMSNLSQTEKEKYINILNDFFKNAKEDMDAEKAAELFDRLSDKLQDAIEPRLMPFIESRMQELGAELDEVQQVVEVQTQQAETTEAAAQANPSDAGLRAKADTAKAALESTKKKGYSLAAKIAGGAAIAALVTVGSAFVYAQVTGQSTGAVLSNLGAAAAGTRPGQMVVGGAKYLGSTRAGQAVGGAAQYVGGSVSSSAQYLGSTRVAQGLGSAASATGSALGRAGGATGSALKSGAQWAGNKALGLGMTLGITAVMNKASAFLGYGAAPAAAPVVPQAAPRAIDYAAGGAAEL